MTNLVSTTCTQLARISADRRHELLNYLLTLASDAAGSLKDPKLDEAFAAYFGRVPRSMGVWHLDVEDDRSYIDKHTSAVWGIKEAVGAKGVPLAKIFKAIHPDDRCEVEGALKKAIETDGEFKSLYRVVSKKQVRWIMAAGQCFFDGKKRPIRFPGTIFEVAEGDPLLAHLRFKRNPTVRLR